jgi:hypothetical protein
MRQSPSVPMLPSPGVLERWLLESPWVLMGVLAVLGLLALLALRRAGRPQAGAGAMIVALTLAGVAFAVATLITTERERLAARTLDMVALVASARTGELSDYLEPGARVVSVLGIPTPTGRESLLESVRRYPGELFPIREHSTSAVQAVQDGANTARTQLRVWVRIAKEQAFYDVPTGSWWRINWRRDPGTGPGQWGPWRVTTIELLQLDGMGR